MAVDAKNVWDFVDGIKPDSQDTARTRLATVSHVDGEGRVWVSIPGSDSETPTASTNTEVARGDTVTVEWRNNALYIVGNSTTPATSSKRVDEKLAPIEAVARKAADGVGTAVDAAEAAKIAAQEAAAAISATNQHFWHNENGAHVTDEAKDDFMSAESAGFPDWQPDPAQPDYKPWYSVLLNSLGQVFRTGSKYLSSFTHSAVAFFDGDGNEPENIVAQFGKYLARIGYAEKKHADFTSDGVEILDGVTSMAKFGATEAKIGKFWYDTDGVHIVSELKMTDGNTWAEMKEETWGDYKEETWYSAAKAIFEPSMDGYNILVDSDGISLLDGDISITEFAANGSRIGRADMPHLEMDSSKVVITGDEIDVARMGKGVVDFHPNPVDGVYIPDGQMASESVYTWATQTGWLKPAQMLHDVGTGIPIVRGSIGWAENGQAEVIAYSGYAQLAVDDNGLNITLDNEQSGVTHKSGNMIIPWEGARQITDAQTLVTAQSGVTITGANFIQWGLIAMFNVTFKSSSALADGSQLTVGQLRVEPGVFPAMLAPGGNTSLQCTIATNGMISARNISGASIAANTSNTIGFTYILG